MKKAFLIPFIIFCTHLAGQTTSLTGLWQIPRCALKQAIGVRPLFGPEFSTRWEKGETMTKKGIPLGGIGAGNMMYNNCGSFGPFCFTPGDYKEIFLPQAAFHVYEKCGDSKNTVTLATEDVLPAWRKIEPGKDDYFSLFPRGWCNYHQFKTEVSLQFFSPIIKDNYKETSLPVGIFLFRLKNTTSKPATISVMFTFPNISYLAFMDTAVKPRKDFQPRKGLFNTVHYEGKITGIVMKANDPGNLPEAKNTGWCIATENCSSYVPIWDGNGDGSDIWNDFLDDGILNNKSYNNQSNLPCGAIVVTKELKPGEESVIPFALTWYFPQTKFKAGTVWQKRYTAWYPEKEDASFEIAKDALMNYKKWLTQVIEWTNPVIRDKAFPEWLKQGALNELYYTTFGSSFWENGCLTKPKKFGNRPGQHLAFVMECNEYRYGETFDVRHHGATAYRELWPEIEKSILLGYADFIMDTPDGSCPHDVGSPDDDPWFNYDAYGKWYNNDAKLGIKGRTTTPWSEYSPKFIQQCYALYHKTKDYNFLKEIWPAAVRTFHYQITTDINGDGLSEMKSSEYLDNKLFNAVLWIGALESMQEMCALMKDKNTGDEVKQQLDMARRSSEKQFWNDSLGYYQFNETKNYLMADAMLGQHYNDLLGLPPVLDEKRMTSHYKQDFRILALPLLDTDHDGVGDVGAGNALTPESKPALGASEWEHQFEVWTGITYSLCANLYAWGKRINDGSLQDEALLTAWGVYKHTWLDEKHPYRFNTPEAWRIDNSSKNRAMMYQRARSVWDLLFAIDNPYSGK